MLTKIEVENFKLFKEKTSFPLSNINIFTGINGRGKSTALQALVLMKQSIEYNKIKNIKYHGKYIELGTFDDIKNFDDNIIFNFYSNENFAKYIFKSDKGNLFKSNSLRKEGSLEVDFSCISFISAERLGPKVVYEKGFEDEFNNVGKRGEFVAGILYDNKDMNVNTNLSLEDGATETLIDQTSEWLNKIFSGAKVNISSITDTVVEILYQGNPKLSIKKSKPTNIGYGYSNVLPIVVAGLTAKENDILIIDSPEAHLHPSAQSELAKFLAKVSLTGVQIFIETHSEHILNGIRIAIHTDHIAINPSHTSLIYFQDNIDEQVKIIQIDEKGGIQDWPQGFFDQYEKDLSLLFGI